MKDFSILNSSWHWAPSGVLIGLVMLSLIWFGREFGLSSTYRTYCSILQGGRVSSFLNIDWKNQRWNLVFVLGIIIGSFLTFYFSAETTSGGVSARTNDYLRNIGLHIPEGGPTSLLPPELFAGFSLDGRSMLVLTAGGILVGFGTQWAGGCTSGHFISGLSNLQVPSLLAIIGFFIGGMISSRFILPLIF